MSTAIYIAALILATAINPEQDTTAYTDAIKAFFWMFAIYDILNMRSSKR